MKTLLFVLALVLSSAASASAAETLEVHLRKAMDLGNSLKASGATVLGGIVWVDRLTCSNIRRERSGWYECSFLQKRGSSRGGVNHVVRGARARKLADALEDAGVKSSRRNDGAETWITQVLGCTGISPNLHTRPYCKITVKSN